jgi:hypothetical protein
MSTKTRKYIEKRKFQILLLSLLLLLLGMHPNNFNLFLPTQIMVVGALIFSNRKWLFNMIIGMLALTLILLITSFFFSYEVYATQSFLGLVFIIFFVAISVEVFARIIKAEKVSIEIISAVLCGFIMLSFIGWFLYDVLERTIPGSFSGLGDDKGKFYNLLYFSVSNMLTLGLGDILPVSILAKKFVMFMGFLGHFYTVFVTGIVIGKYINQSGNNVN